MTPTSIEKILPMPVEGMTETGPKMAGTDDYDCRPPYINLMGKEGSELRKILRYSWQQCWLIIASFILTALSTVTTFTVPLLIGGVVDGMVAKDREAIERACLLMMGIVLGASICAFLASYNTVILASRIIRNITYDLFLSIVNKDISFFDANKTGDLMSRMSSDVEVIGNGLSHSVRLLLMEVIKIIVNVVVMCFVSWQLTLVLLAGILPFSCIVVVVSRYQGKL